MSSIPRISSIGKVKFAKFQATETPNNPVIVTKDYGYDSFTPSFKHANQKATTNVLKKGAMGAVAALMAAGTAVTNTSCNKPDMIVSQTVIINNEEVAALLAKLLAAIQEGNAQNAANFQLIIASLIDLGVSVDTISQYLEQNE